MSFLLRSNFREQHDHVDQYSRSAMRTPCLGRQGMPVRKGANSTCFTTCRVSKKRYSTTIHIHWFKMSFSPTPKKYSQIFGRCANTILCLTICLSWSLGDKFFRMAKTRLEVNIPSYNAPKVFGRENKNILRTWQGSVYDCSSAAFLQSPSSHSKRRMDWSAIFLW